jgi:hypothetical protein
MDGIEMFEEKKKHMLGLLLCVLMLLGACSTKKLKAPTDPEPIEPPDVITELFRGDLPQRGRECHGFTVNFNGSVTLEITELKPLSSLTVGLGLGQPAASDPEICSIIAEDRSVRTFELFLSEGLPSGLYCVCIFDVGNIFPDQTVQYVIESMHP